MCKTQRIESDSCCGFSPIFHPKPPIKMLTNQIQQAVRMMGAQARRNYGVTAVVMSKATDPIQQLFVNKLRDYANKSKSAGGKLVDASPEIERELKQELEKLAKAYGGDGGADMTAFPSFKFEEPKLGPINSSSS
ncbi:hypothetical protein pipiens_016414 [Culex pipiens pipiens]|uniref:ATP synthase-coupling factor 6, mitochondrial n=1 Tax=Culex pipiens pipiens TaxID=38569 RepID=A0ABD1CMC4_CULPP